MSDFVLNLLDFSISLFKQPDNVLVFVPTVFFVVSGAFILFRKLL